MIRSDPHRTDLPRRTQARLRRLLASFIAPPSTYETYETGSSYLLRVAAVGAEGVPEKFITFFKFICFITFATFHLRSHLEMPELGTSSGMTPDPSWKSPGPTEWVPA
jgi:hypothetical protein